MFRQLSSREGRETLMAGSGRWLLAAADARTYFELARLEVMDLWWHWLVFALVVAALIAFVLSTYRRDGHELGRPTRWLLAALRLLAIGGLLIFFLGIEKRTEQKVVKNSRALLLVDTSQSMGLIDMETPGVAQPPRRIDEVVRALAETPFVAQLRSTHDVLVYRFDEHERPVQLASLPRLPQTDDELDATSVVDRRVSEVRWMNGASIVLFSLAAVALLIHLLAPGTLRDREGESWGLLCGTLAVVAALVVVAVNQLRNPAIDTSAMAAPSPADEPTEPERRDPDWESLLAPSGDETRLGDALQFLVDVERGGPIAGIAVFTDGNSNSGLTVADVAHSAADAGVPVFPIGVGSDRAPINLRLVDVEAPAKVYPGDGFTILGYIQAFGLQGQTAKVSLSASEVDAAGKVKSGERLEDQQRITIGADGEVAKVEFEVVPTDLGTQQYHLRIEAPANDLDPGDNQRSVTVHVVDRKSRVLLLAGGPMRDYRFLSVLCYRDKNVTVDVLLQSSSAGAAQEADRVLSEFPATPGEMFEYDCLVAFDPDWEALSDEQLALVERWVSEQAGGLIVVAGPVYTPEWTTLSRERSGLELMQALYPVSFYRRSSARSLGRNPYETSSPWPIDLTDDGRNSWFLRLDDDPRESQALWGSFRGVHSYQSVRGPKPGATVYGRFSDPDSAVDSELPVYFAGQFYGAGRVFYMGSGEMWRLMELDPSCFEQLYTRLIRYVSEGRLLRDSSRGLLIVSKDRCVLGETITVRALLTDAQHKPLGAEQIDATLVTPDGLRQRLELRRIADAAQEGTYFGQFTASRQGDYRIDLPIPESEKLEVLSREVLVRVPDVEIQSPQRNDAVLSELAEETGGQYYASIEGALGELQQPALVDTLTPQNQETYLPGTPDAAFQQRLMAWLLALICGALCLEWLLRRLYKLA
jgi:hypothetical protein